MFHCRGAVGELRVAIGAEVPSPRVPGLISPKVLVEALLTGARLTRSPQMPLAEVCRCVARLANSLGKVTKEGAKVVLFSTGISFRYLAAPRAPEPTVYTPWRGVYRPLSREARVGAQF